MFSTFPILAGQDEYLLCWRLDDCEGTVSGKPAALTFYDHVSAFYFLESVIRDSGQMHDLRLWLSTENRSFAMNASDDSEMMSRVAVMLASGELAAASVGKGIAGGDREKEGILRTGAGAGSAEAAAAETTPLQDETASKQAVETEAVTEDSEESSKQSQAETPAPALEGGVGSEQPPVMVAAADVEEHPEPLAEAETESAPAMSYEAEVDTYSAATESGIEIEEIPAVDAESQSEEAPALASETEPEKTPAVETETATRKNSGVETRVDVPASPAVDSQVDIGKPGDHHD